jgi:hypothetical protein
MPGRRQSFQFADTSSSSLYLFENTFVRESADLENRHVANQNRLKRLWVPVGASQVATTGDCLLGQQRRDFVGSF